MDDLGGKDINDVMKEMEDAEVMLKFSGYLGTILLGRMNDNSNMSSIFFRI